MSELRSSRGLSEFFSDDNSEGHRFVEFIKKRQAVGKQKYLFMDCETDQMSFEVRLEKLSTPELKKAEINLPQNKSIYAPTEQDDPDVARISPIRAEISNRSSARRSGGVGLPSDRLRRLSIKNHCAKRLTGGRRTLLEEFENTIEDNNFQPLVFSTPISQATQSVPQISLNTNPINETQNNDDNNAISSECSSRNTDTLIKTLQRKDAELKGYLDGVQDKTLKKTENRSKIVQKKSIENTIVNKTNDKKSSEHTFTIENRNSPAQLELMPGRSNDQNEQSFNLQQSPNRKSKSRSNMSICPQNKQGQQEAELQITEKKNTETPDLSDNSLPIISSTQNVEIPKTQTYAKDTINIGSGSKQNAMVTSPNHTISEIVNQEKDNIIGTKNSQIYNSPAVQRQSLQEAEDKLKLVDILTDEEETTPKSALYNDNTMPLNLAPRSYNLRNKNIRKRVSSKQKLYKENSQQHAPDTEVEIPPPAHNNKQMPRRKRKPLNRPPGTPLNGEKYAEELARMSNHEILDLRKRNSMGKIFVVSGRRCSLEEVNKNKLQLDYHIEQEILKRNLNDITQNSVSQSDQANGENERLSAHYNFRDSPKAQDKDILEESTFIGENPNDRVKFKTKEKKSPIFKKKKIPEILKQYLEVSKKYSKRMQRKSGRNITKRSLFSMHESYAQENPTEKTSYEENTTSYSRSKKLSIPYLKSPPKTRSDLVKTPKVVSPPPTITTTKIRNTPIEVPSDILDVHTTTGEMQNTPDEDVAATTRDIQNTPNADADAVSTTRCEIPNTHNKILTNVDVNTTLPPPPPGFESDFINTNQYTTNVTPETTTRNTSKNSKLNTNNDDHLFKKPLNPVPKKKVKKTDEKSANKLQKPLADNQRSTDLTEGGSLRRSKRGHVPISQPAILNILYQQLENKIAKIKERKRIVNKDKQRKEKKKIKKNSKTTENLLLPVPENGDSASDSRSQSTKLAEKAKAAKSKGNQTNNATQSQKEHVPSNESIQCSRLILNKPPPFEHLNNMFDRLKQNSSTTNATMPATTTQFKIKPLKIRVRRLKPFEKKTNIDSPISSSTSTCSSINSNIELVSWLKDMSGANNTDQQTTEIFKDVRISSAINLCFTELQGLEYAFYDTEEKACLGYLRFKPHQIKPKKKAKRFDLQYINLVGLFRIKVNNSENLLGVGDVITIEKFAYYDIQNLNDSVSILMVIKKNPTH